RPVARTGAKTLKRSEPNTRHRNALLPEPITMFGKQGFLIECAETIKNTPLAAHARKPANKSASRHLKSSRDTNARHPAILDIARQKKSPLTRAFQHCR
ncbi:hypothetical protein, partial [Senegalimassilia anaerobia]